MFKLIPTWPFVVGALVIGLGTGAYADHKVMQGRIDKITIAHAETLRVREVQRVKDEVAAREEERRLVRQAGQIEQEKTNEIATIRAAHANELGRLQNRATRKPTPAGAMPGPAPACQGSTGAELSREDATFLIGEAARADEHRAALSACYRAYDSVAFPNGTADTSK
jgi:hypothetical protein